MATVEMYCLLDANGCTKPAPGYEHLIGNPPEYRLVIGSNGLPVYTEIMDDNGGGD